MAPARAAPAQIERVVYEGYGPGGAAMLVEALTDNRNRTGAEIRHAFDKHGGSLGEPGSVAWQFEKRGVVLVDAERYSEDDLIRRSTRAPRTSCADDDMLKVDLRAGRAHRRARGARGRRRRDRVRRAGDGAQGVVEVGDAAEARRLMRLMDALDDHDDVDEVHANFDMSAELLEEAEAAA